MKYARSPRPALSLGRRRDRKRGMPCASMILTSRTCGSPAVGWRAWRPRRPRSGTFVLVPRSGFAQQQVGELDAAFDLLGERLRGIGELAMDRGKVLVVGAP